MLFVHLLAVVKVCLRKAARRLTLLLSSCFVKMCRFLSVKLLMCFMKGDKNFIGIHFFPPVVYIISHYAV